MTGTLTLENRQELAELIVSYWNRNSKTDGGQLRALLAYNGVLVSIRHHRGNMTGAKILIPSGALIGENEDGDLWISIDDNTTLEFSRYSGIVYSRQGFMYEFCDIEEG